MHFDYTLFLCSLVELVVCVLVCIMFSQIYTTIPELYKIEMIVSVNIKSKKNSELQNEMHKKV